MTPRKKSSKSTAKTPPPAKTEEPKPEISELPDAEPLLSQIIRDRVKQMRTAKGWTLEELAAASGVSRSMLSQIERGLANPTLGVAWRIARSFGLKLAELVDAPENIPHIDVVRAKDPHSLFRNDVHCRIRTLSPLQLEKDVEFYEVLLNIGGVLDSAAHFAGTREFLTVEQGVIRLTSGGETCELSQGDSAHYPADVPHRLENLQRSPAVVFLVVIYSATKR